MKATVTTMEKMQSTLKIPTNGEFSGKTKIELRQAIANLTRQNIGGVYDARIAKYQTELATLESTPCEVIKHNPAIRVAEMEAIMLFNSDPRFTITE